MKSHVFLGVPLYDGRTDFGTTVGLMGATLAGLAVTVCGRRAALGPAYTANELWSRALNARARGVTHFAMLHADVRPEPGWLDVLLNVLDREDADVVSAVIPIKDDKGLTSTAVDNPPDQKRAPRMLTLAEVHDLPRRTFDAADTGFPGKILCVNTGCWAARLDRPWCEAISFAIHTRIVRRPNGTFETVYYPEDWDFSTQLARHGARVLATLEVRLTHGDDRCTNAEPWGTVRDMDALDVSGRDSGLAV